MLHPALTRFMAVLLAILCIILFLVSYFGLNDAEELKEDDIAAHNKLTERIATYERLTAELAELEEYKKANEKLSQQEEEHESTASQHRTDLAEHTAKEGAFKQGADALWEAKAQLDEQKIMFDVGVAEFNKKEAEFEQMKAMVQGMLTLAEGCAAVAQIPPVPDPGAAPEPPQAPVAPMKPEIPADPGEFTQQPPREEDYIDDPETYQAALEAYNQALNEHTARKQAYEQAKLAEADYQNKLNEYNNDLEFFNTVTVPDYQKAAAEHAVKLELYQTYTSKVTSLMQGGAATLGALGMPAPSDPASMAQALQQAYNEILPTIEMGEKGIAEGKAALQQAEKALKDGEHTIQTNLELIWYQMGQAEEQAQDLAEEKEELEDNSAQLEKEREILEKQKEDENKLRSTRILLMQNKTIEERVNAGGELAETSKQYAEEFEAQYEKQYEIRRVLCYLGMAAGILGILVLPAAFELIRSRILLLMPAFLSFLASALAETLSVRSGEGQFYVAIPVIFFSLLYILAARGRKRIIRE